MYNTKLDDLVVEISDDVFNHKHFRPLIKWKGKTIRHLLLPDIQTYIFNFVFDSKQVELKSDYIIDIISKKYYGTTNVYPLLNYINGFTGIQDLPSGTTLFTPNNLSGFVNKYYNKYEKNTPVEEPVELPEEMEDNNCSSNTDDTTTYLSQLFGSLFVECGG